MAGMTFEANGLGMGRGRLQLGELGLGRRAALVVQIGLAVGPSINLLPSVKDYWKSTQ